MAYKKWLVEGFCPIDEYNCLMPVEYESVEVNGVVQEYEKRRMACRHVLNGGCPHEAECKFFQLAPERMEKGANWST